jgi:hypothetical protein
MDIHIEDLDTKEEIHFAWYLEELKAEGYILGYQNHPYTFILSEQVKFDCIKQPIPKKAEPRTEVRELLPKNTYTPDFAIYWTKKAEGVFFEKIGSTSEGIAMSQSAVALDKNTPFWTYWNTTNFPSHFTMLPSLDGAYDISLVDVKPDVAKRFAKNISSIYTFPIEQKWVMEKYGIFVQKIVAEGKKTCLFAKTFTPNRYLTNDKISTLRNIHHKTPTLSTYVAHKFNEYVKIKKRYNSQGILFDRGDS